MIEMDIFEILKDRKKYDDEIFYRPLIAESEKDGISIVRRKKWRGVEKDGMLMLSPLYDEVSVLSDRLVILTVGNKQALYDTEINQLLSDFGHVTTETVEDYIVLATEDGRKDIWHIPDCSNLICQGDYEEYNLKDPNTEYVWCRRGKYYDYICRATGEIVGMAGVIMAYDTEYGIFGRVEGDKVVYVERGIGVKMCDLRKRVMEAGGYLRLCNHTYNLQHVIDVYGNILNE